MSLITNFMIEATPVSVANPVHAPFSLVRMCVPDAGGGSRPIIVNVDYIRNISIRKKGKLLFTCRKVAFHMTKSHFPLMHVSNLLKIGYFNLQCVGVFNAGTCIQEHHLVVGLDPAFLSQLLGSSIDGCTLWAYKVAFE